MKMHSENLTKTVVNLHYSRFSFMRMQSTNLVTV